MWSAQRGARKESDFERAAQHGRGTDTHRPSWCIFATDKAIHIRTDADDEEAHGQLHAPGAAEVSERRGVAERGEEGRPELGLRGAASGTHGIWTFQTNTHMHRHT